MNLDFVNLFQISAIAKLFMLVLALFYVIFNLVVYRQISLMTQVLDSKISPAVKFIALIQIIASMVLFVLIAILA